MKHTKHMGHEKRIGHRGRMRHQKSWHALSDSQRVGTIAVIAAQMWLQGAALADLRQRPQSEIRGGKSWWRAALFVNFLGPIAYLVVGRR